MSSKSKIFVCGVSRKVPAPHEPKKVVGLISENRIKRQELAEEYEKGRRLGFSGERLRSHVQKNR